MRERVEIAGIREQGRERAALHRGAQPPASVAENGDLRVYVERSEIACQTLLCEQVRAVDTAELVRDAAQELRHIRILPPGDGAVFLKARFELTAVIHRAQLGVHGGDKGAELRAAAAEPAGDVLLGKRAFFPHGLRGVVERRERVDVIGVPAAVLVDAAYAYPVRRPVEDGGYVAVVGGLGQAALDDAVELAVGVGERSDPGGDETAQIALAAPAPSVMQQHADRAEKAARKQDKDHRGGEGLVQQGRGQGRIPDARGGKRGGEHERERENKAAVAAEHAGEQTGKSVGHRKKAGAPGGEIHDDPQHGPRRRAREHPALERGGHQHDQRERAADGQQTEEPQRRKAHQHERGKHRERDAAADLSALGQIAVGSQGKAAEIGPAEGKSRFQHERGQVRDARAGERKAAQKGRQSGDGRGGEGHEQRAFPKRKLLKDISGGKAERRGGHIADAPTESAAEKITRRRAQQSGRAAPSRPGRRHKGDAERRAPAGRPPQREDQSECGADRAAQRRTPFSVMLRPCRDPPEDPRRSKLIHPHHFPPSVYIR